MRGMFVVLLSFLVLLPVAARADYYVWKDAATGLSFSFPDTWKILQNRTSDDLLTIMPPASNDWPVCRVRAREDKRFLMYPNKLAEAVQVSSYNEFFWQDYLEQNVQNPVIYIVQNSAGLGRNYASYAIATYSEPQFYGPRERQGMMFASLYNGRAYILDCSADAQAFGRWKPLFQSIASSIDFQKVINERPYGWYRDFMQDANVITKDAKSRQNKVY